MDCFTSPGTSTKRTVRCGGESMNRDETIATLMEQRAQAAIACMLLEMADANTPPWPLSPMRCLACNVTGLYCMRDTGHEGPHVSINHTVWEGERRRR